MENACIAGGSCVTGGAFRASEWIKRIVRHGLKSEGGGLPCDESEIVKVTTLHFSRSN